MKQTFLLKKCDMIENGEFKILEIDKIKISPIEICNEMALCIAYCIGATSDNVEEKANKIPENVILECIDIIRNRMESD